MNSSRSALEWLIDARRYAGEAHGIAHSGGDAAWDARDYLAVRHCLMILGEALDWIPDEVLARDATIPWRKVIALRHRLVHAYWLIDDGIIFEIARNETAPLIAALDRLIADTK